MGSLSLESRASPEELEVSIEPEHFSGRSHGRSRQSSRAKDPNECYQDEHFEQIVQQQTITGLCKAKDKFLLSGTGETKGMHSDASEGEDHEGPFAPTECSPLYAYLDDLSHSLDSLMQAPPDYRLASLMYQAAALEHEKWQQEARGETWDPSSACLGATQPATKEDQLLQKETPPAKAGQDQNEPEAEKR
ncbi:unnamed protein product, partial [Chrysoparadoxa australica]